ncbi:hypothetical protein FQZ97_997500 [compost metagenome]
MRSKQCAGLQFIGTELVEIGGNHGLHEFFRVFACDLNQCSVGKIDRFRYRRHRFFLAFIVIVT